MSKGSNYVSSAKVNRSEADFYQTPRPLTWELLKLDLFDYNKSVLEPACGEGAITYELTSKFNADKVINYDVNKYSGLDDSELNDFFNEKRKFNYIITNPPFSQFDDFVLKAKDVATEKIAFIGKTNFFGAEKRNRHGVWKHLKHVFVFNRQVDYRYFRDDNKMQTGNLITGWFIWDMNWTEDYWMTSIIDVQQYIA